MSSLPDPVTAGAVVAAGAGLRAVLGPTFHEVGEALGRATKSRLHNLGQIAEKAERKVSQITDEGAVHPRVAAKVIEDGSWCDDDVMQEYLAGVLVGSRTEDGRDDRGVYWADLVSRLASSYVRVHYLIYRALRDYGQAGPPSLNLLEGQRARSVFLPFEGLGASLGLSADDAGQVAHSAMPVLAREGLIGPEWGTGEPAVLRFAGATSPGLHAVPTHAGMELFLWAHGKRATNLSVLLMPEYDLPDFAEHLAPTPGALVGIIG